MHAAALSAICRFDRTRDVRFNPTPYCSPMHDRNNHRQCPTRKNASRQMSLNSLYISVQGCSPTHGEANMNAAQFS